MKTGKHGYLVKEEKLCQKRDYLDQEHHPKM